MKYPVKKNIYISLMLFFCIGQSNAGQEKPSVVLIDPWCNSFACGAVQTNFAYATTFFDQNHSCVLVCCEKSIYPSLLKKNSCLYSFFSYGLGRRKWPKVLEHELRSLSAKHLADVVVTLRYEDVPQLIELGKQLHFKVVLYRIASIEEDNLLTKISNFQGLDGFVGMPSVVSRIEQEAKKQGIHVKHYCICTPFWDEKKYAKNTSNEVRHDYLKKILGSDAFDAPIIATVANFANPCKNYPLLLHALALVKNKHGKKFHALLAGSGTLRAANEQLAQTLALGDCVHFLGSVTDVSSLLYHSAMHVLPSYFENFSLANIEAAYMKKPVIVAREIDAAAVVKEGETGLLFANNDAQDLAMKILALLDNPEWAKRMGQNGHEYIMQYYCNEALYKKWHDFLNRVTMH